MNNNQDKLIDLHKIEKRLLDINSLRGDLPNKINIINKKIDSLVSENSQNQSRLEEIEKRKKVLNNELSDIEGKVNTLNEQMYKVKSNREYEALLTEIDHLNNENVNILKELEDFDEEIQNIESSISSNNEVLEELNKELSNKEDELTDTNSEFQKEEEELENNKNTLIKELTGIDESLIGIYNDKKVEYDGLAFAEISRNCCGNCYSSLPAQSVIDAKNRQDFVLCPSCNILLYVEVENLVNEE